MISIRPILLVAALFSFLLAPAWAQDAAFVLSAYRGLDGKTTYQVHTPEEHAVLQKKVLLEMKYFPAALVASKKELKEAGSDSFPTGGVKSPYLSRQDAGTRAEADALQVDLQRKQDLKARVDAQVQNQQVQAVLKLAKDDEHAKALMALKRQEDGAVTTAVTTTRKHLDLILAEKKR